MSFGYAVGDVIAILQLFERVALEVRNYHNAPQHFQQLGAELQLLQGTLRRLLQLEPTCEDEKQQLEHIRAIVIHCHQPIQAFINKMRGSENSLGHVRPSTTLSTIGRRLHWSLITKNDVDDLRKVVMSEMIAINMLLGLQQLSALKRIKSGGDFATSSEVKQFCTQSQNFFSTSSLILNDLEILPAGIAGLQTKMAEQASRQNQASTQVIEHLDTVSSQSRALVSQGTSTVARLGRLENQISRSFRALISIARDIKEILCRLRTFSKDFSERITANGRKLLDMHAMLKSLVRAVEAIPLHLTLPIVRLDDALGESWALPYQACQTLRAFEEVVRSVVFAGGRPGSGRVELGQFVIRTIKDGAPLNSQTWTSAVKEGAHLTQAMVLLATKNDLRKCFVSGCSGHLQSGGNCCDVCGRSSSSEISTTSPLRITANHEDKLAPAARMQRHRGRGAFAPMLSNKIDPEKDDIKIFRNVHLVEKRPPIASVEEALRILERDPLDPNASQYLGWHLLCSGKESTDAVENAITCLKRSISQDARQLESHYLLGRAFMDLSDHQEAYYAYQHCAYYNGRSATVWLSVGLLYYQIGQYTDCLDAFRRAIRVNPYEPLVWRNLGVLYDICNHQERDAIGAYTRAFDVGLNDSECQARLNALQDYMSLGTSPPPRTIQMKDFDLRTATYDVYEPGQHDPIEIAELRLENESDGADSESASDDGQSTSDNESDGDINHWTLAT